MNEALKTRLITAAVLGIAALLVTLVFSTPWFAVVAMVLVITLGGMEWTKLVSIKHAKRTLYVVGMLLLAYFAFKSATLSWFFVSLGFLWWIINLVMLYRYKADSNYYVDNPFLLRVSGLFVLVSAWSAAVVLHAKSPYLILYLIFLVAVTDTAAFFGGKSFGKNKLVPHISPGKTREGLFAGVIAALVFALICAAVFGFGEGQFSRFVYWSIAAALMSVAGDLFISLIKREAGQKDSGNLLPGHGGILDRVDGLIAALPLFALGMHWSAI